MSARQAWADLRTLDTRNPAGWPDWVRIAAAALLAVGVCAAILWFWVRGNYEDLESLRAQEQALRTEFETKQRKVASLDLYKEQLKQMEKSFAEMLMQLPGKAEVANLLNDISQTRVAASLEEELFQPQPEVPKDFYAEVPNRIVVVGGYHQMGEFVSNVAALPRIVTIDQVEIKPAGGTTPRGTLRMTALAKTYRYLEDSEMAAAAKKPGDTRQ